MAVSGQAHSESNCTADGGSNWLDAGQAKKFSNGFSIRLDSIMYDEKLPDTYVISLKDEQSGAIVLNKISLKQNQSVQANTRCGVATIGGDRSAGSIKINISFF